MRKLYTLGHSRCRLQSHAQVGASSPFTHCTRFVFVLLLLLGGVMQGVEGQIVPSTYFPANGAIEVDVNTQLVLDFDTNISFGTIGTTSFLRIYEYKDASPYVLHSEYKNSIVYDGILEEDVAQYDPNISIEGTRLIITLKNPLSNGVKYFINIGNSLISGYAGIKTSAKDTWVFTTAPAAPAPIYTALSPANLEENVSLSPTLRMTFNENVTKSGITGKALRVYQEGVIDPVGVFYADDSRVTVSNSVVNITGLSLAAGEPHYVTVEAGFVKSSTSGVDFGGISGSKWTFTTGSAPQLAAEKPLTPANGASGVALDAILTARFDQSIRFNTSTDVKYINIVKRVDGSNTPVASYALGAAYSVPTSLSIDAETNSLIIDGESDYEFGTDYSVDIESGAIESSIGIPFSGLQTENSWTFRTLDAPAPVGTMATPLAGDLNISILTDVLINYDMAIRNLDGSAITDANVKDLINIYQGVVATENLMPLTDYTATIAADKKSITIRLTPGSYYNPNSEVNIVIGKVENNQSVEQNIEQTFAFHTGIYNTWSGTTDSDWTKVSNWGGTYTEGASVIIRSSANGAVLASNLSIPNMIIAEGGKLTINPGVTLTVNSYFRMYSVNGAGASASLVVNGTLSTVPSKTFVYQGITNSAFNYYVSSPVNAAVKSVVNPDGRMYAYNTATDVFDRLADDALLTPLKGYGAMAPAGSWLSFSGSLNGGDYSLSCYRTAKNYGWNLAGNPYPCAIDLQKTYDAGGFSNLRDHIYIRDNETFIQNAYNFYSKVGTLSGNAVVPAMHSFWVQVKPGFSEGTFSVKNTDRVHNSFNYHKSASSTPVQKPTIKLFAQNGAVKDLSVITFIPGNDDAYDAYDSEKRLARNNLVTDLYTIKDGMRLVINSFGEYSGSKEVPIGVYAKKAGTYTLGIASMAGFDQEVELKLVDYGTSPATTHDLSTDDYSFTVAADTYIDHRFVLQISNKVTTGVEQPEANREVTMYAFQSDVVIENKGDAVGQYTIYDLSGRVLTSGEVGAFSKISAPMSVKGVVLGVVKTSKGMVNQKLLIQ